MAAAPTEVLSLALPDAGLTDGTSLMQALRQRRSQREFQNGSLPMQVLAELLWAACGINRPAVGGRTVPRAINLQEIDVYVALASGLYRYEPVGHMLRLQVARDLRGATGNQDFPAEAALNLVFVADHSKVKLVQAEQREAYAYIMAGAIAQNVSLYCASRDLATVIRCWIDIGPLHAAMALTVDQQILLAQTVGYPISSA
jgi:nitroreductase